jgi:hypothetical protein
MAEGKKPKIDLKTRIPSKTVKGLTPIPGGAIPPPPGAVPAPPPDLLGRRSMPPKVSADPNDPLGAARVEGGHQPQQQIVVVEAHPQDSHAGSKKGVFYAIVAVVLVAGAGLGFVIGSATAKGSVATKAKADAKELGDKVSKTNEGLGKLVDSLKTANSEIDNKGLIEQATIDAIKGWNSGFTTNDLKTREIAYFGEDVAGKLLTYAQKVGHIDELKAQLTKANGLENASAQLKAFAIPKGAAKYGVQLDKPKEKEPPITTASIVDFGESLDLKTKIDTKDPKAPKLTLKNGQLDVWPGGKVDFWDKAFISAIDAKDWLKACPVYAQASGYAKQGIQEIVVAIEGSGDDQGAVKPGTELASKLKNLAK